MATRDPRMSVSNFPGIRRSMKRATPAVVLMLILVGCGGGTQAPATASASQPQASAAGVPTLAPSNATGGTPAPAVVFQACDYMTPEEVAVTAGMSQPFPAPSDDELYSYCTYSGPGAPELKIFVSKTAETAATAFNTAKANSGEAVSGVGDEAYWGTDSFLPGLYFMKSGLLGYISGSASGPEDRIIELGKLFAERIAEVN